jgi:oxalate decarboxylase/phosphoglucose isomerase-like protein (cupin superfamily)
VDSDPGVPFAKHWHPGEEIIHVLEGPLEYQVEGKPPVTLKVGDFPFIPAGTIHAARNVRTGPGAEVATYVVERPKPLVMAVRWSVRSRSMAVGRRATVGSTKGPPTPFFKPDSPLWNLVYWT